jgi:hypothetical protein
MNAETEADATAGEMSAPETALADARYVVAQIVRGEVLPGAGMRAAQPLVQAAAGAIETFDPHDPATLVALQAAMAALMAAISPVTLQSLKDTEAPDRIANRGFIWRLLRNTAAPDSPAAFRFSARFVVFSSFAVAIAVLCTVADDQQVSQMLGERAKVLFKLLLPYAYGAVGSCVYLLRSLHRHIYSRTFDRRRKPEYVNRVLLGMVSGGIIGLFLGAVKEGADHGAQIGSSALGFLAGYNIDLLFTALERVTNSILPKAEPPPAPQQVQPPPVSAAPPAVAEAPAAEADA